MSDKTLKYFDSTAIYQIQRAIRIVYYSTCMCCTSFTHWLSEKGGKTKQNKMKEDLYRY